MRRLLGFGLLIAAGSLSGCGAEPGADDLARLRQALTPAERVVRAGEIREAAAARGLYNGILLAGIADVETGMSHCHSELTWACEGPASADCGGGPVVAGSADGPCENEQGGLGMFQFDAGTYAQTLAREGDRILSIAGNTDAAVDFVINMVKRSVYTDAETDEQAIAWMNRVRPWNELWAPWVQTVTRYYNGCVPGSCSVYDQRYSNYSNGGIDLLAEMGVDFWYGREPACERIPASGGTLDETGFCFAAGGNPQYWRNEPSGFEDHLLWTGTTSAAEHANFAKWYFRFDQPGRYELEVYTASSFAQSEQALYLVDSGDNVVGVSLNQAAHNGWQSLGQFDFLGVGTLRLNDNTGELSGAQLAADAVRVTPRQGNGGTAGVAGSAAGGSSAGGNSAGGSAGLAGGATGGAAGSTGFGGSNPATRTESEDGGCGCRTAPKRGAGGAGGAGRDLPLGAPAYLALGLVLATRRRARR